MKIIISYLLVLKSVYLPPLLWGPSIPIAVSEPSSLVVLLPPALVYRRQQAVNSIVRLMCLLTLFSWWSRLKCDLGNFPVEHNPLVVLVLLNILIPACLLCTTFWFHLYIPQGNVSISASLFVGHSFIQDPETTLDASLKHPLNPGPGYWILYPKRVPPSQ